MNDLDKPTSREIEELEEGMRGKVCAMLVNLRNRGLHPYVYETLRSTERAVRLSEEGHSKAGKASKHCVGKAVDIIDGAYGPDGMMIGWGDSVEGTSKEVAERRQWLALDFFKALGEEAHAAKLTWGGSWHMRDLAHVEAP